MDRRHLALCALALAIGCNRASNSTSIRADPPPAAGATADAAKVTQPVILATGLAWPEYLFVEKDAVLVVLRYGGDRIVEIPKRGGEPRTVVPFTAVTRAIWAVAADAGHVHFVDGDTQTVHAVDRTTGADVTIGASKCESSVSCFVFAEEKGVIWNGPNIKGTALPTLAVDAHRGLVVLRDSFVALSRDSVRRVDRNSRAISMVAHGFDNPVLVTANASTVAYVVSSDRGMHLVGSKTRVALDEVWVEAAIANDRDIYALGHRGKAPDDERAQRTLWRVPIAEGAPTPMSEVRGENVAVAIDDAFVYWIDYTQSDDGRLLRLPL